MKLLNAINRILPALGENPIDSIDSRNPTVAVVNNAILAKLNDTMTREWWFNTYVTTLFPNDTGKVALPSNTIAWLPKDTNSVQRGGFLYNGDTMTFEWPVGVGLEGVLKITVPFEELPEAAATFVLYSACIQAYVNDIGLEDTVQEWKEQEGRALIVLEAEHLRNRKYTTQSSRRYGRYRQALRG